MKRLLLFLIAPLCWSLVFCASANAATPTPAAAAKTKPATSGKSDAAAERAPGRDPSFGFVAVDELMRGVPQVKETAAKLEEEKATAKKEYEKRIADYQKLEAELRPLNQRLAAAGADDPARADLTKERDEKVNLLKTKEREINEFRQQRESDVQQKSAAMREPVVADIKAAAGRLGPNVNLVLDFSGLTLSGVPFVVLHPVGADMTSRLAAGLGGKDPGSVNSTRGVKVAITDMNKVFTQLQRTKEAETKINASREAARAEDERRSATYKEELAKVDTVPAAEKEKQTARARVLEAELNEFRTKKSAQLQQEMVEFGKPILVEMSNGLGKMAGEKVGLVFDTSGMGLSGVPLLVWSKDVPDLSNDLVAMLNGDKRGGKTTGMLSTSLRFGVVDVERAYRALPDGQQAETEIQEATQRALAEAAEASAAARMEKQQQLQNLTRSKRQAVLSKIVATLNDVGRAGEFNAVFDSSGKTMSQMPAVVAARDVPDLTEDVIAKASTAAK